MNRGREHEHGRPDSLVIDGLTVQRGGLAVCSDVSLRAPAGEITVLLGANGAGKSSLLDGVAGLLPASAGAIYLGERRIDAWPTHRRAAAGLAYVEQGRTVFGQLTVAQNIAVVDRSRDAFDRACALFPHLAEKRDLRASVLSGGEQQMLVIARALAAQPRFLLVDELSLGLAPRLAATLIDAVAELAASGTGVLLVEQFAELALRVGESAYVLQRGRVVLHERCAVLRADPTLLGSAYLFGDPQT